MVQTREQSLESEACREKPFDIAGGSHVGRRRSRNEDRFLIADLNRLLSLRDSNVPYGECEQLCSHRTGQLLVVADGMGGHSGGDIASRVAVESCARYVLDMLHWFLKLNDDHEQDFLDDLANCLRSIQQRIWSKSQAEPVHRMGTTVTMAYLLWPRMYVVHAGDSRCYLNRDSELVQITTDHTIAQQMVDCGALDSEDVKVSRWRSVLWNCVGGDQKVVQPEVCRVNLEPGDRLLLCSDGLSDMIDDTNIAKLLAAGNSAETMVQELINSANEAGGKDNITAIVGLFQAAGTDSFGSTLRDTDLDNVAN